MTTHPVPLVSCALLLLVGRGWAQEAGAPESPAPPESPGAEEPTTPPAPPPAEAPPPAPSPVPAPPQPDARAEEESPPPGQWVYTQQYGWVWMPYSDAYTHVPDYGYGQPYMFVYYPAYGWSWVVAPWVWGVGPWPYFGVYGGSRFGWHAHFVGWGHHRFHHRAGPRFVVPNHRGVLPKHRGFVPAPRANPQQRAVRPAPSLRGGDVAPGGGVVAPRGGVVAPRGAIGGAPPRGDGGGRAPVARPRG